MKYCLNYSRTFESLTCRIPWGLADRCAAFSVSMDNTVLAAAKREIWYGTGSSSMLVIIMRGQATYLLAFINAFVTIDRTNWTLLF